MKRGKESPAGIVIVAGPTAGGKSALALTLARHFDGVIVNADSMQVYRELAVLTARPCLPDLDLVPHRLYGVLSMAEPCSVARWCALAKAEIAEAESDGRLPIIVGGTGLYLKSLVEGLAPIPDIPETVRADARVRLVREGSETLWRDLLRRDPATAAILRPTDSQRIQRALEVALATDRPLSEWQAMPREGAYGGPVLSLSVAPPRATLYARCDRRFRRMVARGALDEAAAILGLGLDPTLPAMKAVGLRELMGHVRGKTSLADAAAKARQSTRNYAKRQTTWFRHQMVFDAQPSSATAAVDRVAAFVG